MSGNQGMRGLLYFITDLRSCKCRADEDARVNKELSHIRTKFKEPNLSGYNKKKYVAKLLYLLITGREVDFGHLEGLSLLSSRKYSEKQMGYLAVTMFLPKHPNLLPVVVRAIQVHACCALHAIANMDDVRLSTELKEDILRLFFAGAGVGVHVQKKAILCLVQLYRQDPHILPPEALADALLELMDTPDLGVLQCVVTLALELAPAARTAFEPCYGKALDRLLRLVVGRECAPGYVFYKAPAPWLQVKLLRLLQAFPPCPTGDGRYDKLNRVLRHVLLDLPLPGSVQNLEEFSSRHAVELEVIHLAVHAGVEADVFDLACGKFGAYLAAKDPNLRYLGLETMARLIAYPATLPAIQAHYRGVLGMLQDRDPSILRRALDLLFNLCNEENCADMVRELLLFLAHAEPDLQQDVVVRVAFIVEKFARDFTWCMDVVLELLRIAGDQVPDALWYRVVRLVTNQEKFRPYAIASLYAALQGGGGSTTEASTRCHEKTVMLAGYLFGEFGHLIASHAGSAPADQFHILHEHFRQVSARAKALLLSTFLKFANMYPEIRPQIVAMLEDVQHLSDSEVQQRACEYLAILQRSAENMAEGEAAEAEDILALMCEEMPKFREEGVATLLSMLQGRSSTSAAPPVGDAGSPVRARSPSPDARPVQLVEQAELYRKLLTAPSGVLYEDQYLQIGLKSDWGNGPQGRVYLFFGNKHAQDLTELQLTLQVQQPSGRASPPADRLSVGEEGSGRGQQKQPQPVGITLYLEGAGTPTSLAAGEQVPLCWVVECADVLPGSATAPPLLHLGYRVGHADVFVEVQVPATLNKFLTPARLSQPEFCERWRKLDGRGRDCQFSVDLGLPGSARNAEMAALLEGFGLGAMVEQEEEGERVPSPTGAEPPLLAAGILSTVCLGKVGCLVRRVQLSTEGSWVLKTTNAVVTAELRHLLLQVLRGPG